MHKINIMFAAAAAVATTLTFSTVPAFAADGAVTWKGLDLATEAGRAELDSRIETAAQSICSTGAMTGSRIDRGPSRSCLADARTEIRTQIARKLPATPALAMAPASAANSEAR